MEYLTNLQSWLVTYIIFGICGLMPLTIVVLCWEQEFETLKIRWFKKGWL
jgi:uncharacterized membrane protein YuzA (DUF378 family)